MRLPSGIGPFTASFVALLGASSGGCGGGGTPGFVGFPDEVIFTSTHFRYHSHASDPEVCAAVLDDLESHYTILHDFLALPPNDAVIDYWHFVTSGDLETYHPCGSSNPNVGNCSIGAKVYSVNALDQHELIHAYLASIRVNVLSFLAEGLADGLTCDYPPAGAAGDDVVRARLAQIGWQELTDWRPVDDVNTDSADYYRLSSTLVRLLFDQFGAGPILAYYATASDTQTAAQANAGFQAAFGFSLEDALAMVNARALLDGPCLRPYACGAPPLAGSAGPEAVAFRCQWVSLYRRFNVATAGTVAIEMVGDGAGLGVPFARSCDGELSPRDGPPFVINNHSELDLTWLSPGDYTVGFPTPRQAFSAQLVAAQPPWPSSSCDGAATAPVAVDGRDLALNVPPTGDTYFLALSAAPARAVRVAVARPRVSSVRLCRSCADDPSTCEAIPPVNGPLRITLDGSYVLEIATAGLGEYTSVQVDETPN